MIIIYRISDSGYNKVKPLYINNSNCLKNAVRNFGSKENTWIIIADNVSEKTLDGIHSIVPQNTNVKQVSVGHGAGTFNIALDIALTYNDSEIIYFLENDYLHRDNSEAVLIEGISTGSDYVSLYDHPDKYIDGANPYVESGGEVTRVIMSNSSHWKLTNSTTMTFASKVETLREDETILREYTSQSYPRDFEMFLKLRDKGRTLITPIPGYSTHGESNWLSPLINWENI